MQTNNLFERFAPVIRNLTNAELDGAPSLNAQLRLAQDGDIEVCYAPFDFINPRARVVIVGITPGRTQMLNALREARRQLDAGATSETALKAAKQTAAFSGAMRPNLINLLDRIGLHDWLKIGSCAELFQTTSVLRNPVFHRGGNYNGAPDMTHHPVLREQLEAGFGQDAATLREAVFIPLGVKVTDALIHLADRSLIQRERILSGLPHPSGANAERIAYFLGTKPRSALSAKTDPDKLDQALASIRSRVRALS